MKNLNKKVLMGFIMIALSTSLFTGCSFGGQTAKAYTFDPGEYFITNMLNSKSLIKTDIIIELNDQNAMDVLSKAESTPKVRDVIITILRSKTYEELSAVNAQEVLKQEIANAIKQQFFISGVENIYFNEYVIQN